MRIDKAVALLAHGFRKEALEELNVVISKDEKNTKALFYKALTLVEMNGNLSEAKEILQALKTGNHPFREKAAGLLEKLESK